MNAPMKVNTVVDPNGASNSSEGATSNMTSSATPSRPATGIGNASVIHNTMTPTSRAASVCWD
jgi:hypothetical protein